MVLPVFFSVLMFSHFAYGGGVNKHMLESVLGSFYFEEKKICRKVS